MGRRVSSEELVALQGHQESIRNVCILAHVDHGKTTLSDSLVSSNGIISAKLAGKLRFLDSTEEEQQRGITMKSSAISLLHTKEIRRRGPDGAPLAGPGSTAPVGAAPPPSTAEGPPGPNPPSSGAAQAGAPQQQPPPPQAQAPPAPAATQDYLINLIDSPGHIDFSSDVSTATRLSDGAIVIVDVLEGVCTQTHAVLRQAWNERMKPCLVLNKLDRLIMELRLTPLEAYWHLQQVLERVNAISSSLITNETFRLDETEDFADNLEKEWLFAPERGNVVFASSLYCWAFGVGTFARIWAGKLGVKRGLLQRHLWGEFVFNAKTLAVSRYTQDSKAKPMFVAMVLDPIWQLYEVTVLDQDLDKAAKMVKRLGLEVPPRELNPKDPRGTASAIFRRWLPLAPAVLDMVVDVVPDPVSAQHRRIAALWPPDPISATNAAAAVADDDGATAEVRAAVAACAKTEAAPVVAFVSKVVPVRAAELVGWRPPVQQQAAEGAREEDGPADVFVAFARVFSGVLRPDSRLFVLGPKYHPKRRSTASHAQPLPSDGGPLGLFMMMGTSMQPVPFVPAGNLVAIAGVEGLVIKSATLASTLACPALQAMTLQAKPIVRVAVEAVRQSDLDALERGLAKLYQADPAVEISVQENGEHVITALGELHLEQCIKDLRERYARVEVRASTPLVVFRESVAPGASAQADPVQLSLPPWSEEEGASTSSGGLCRLVTSSGDCRIAVQCFALPDRLAQLLDTHPYEVRALVNELAQDAGSALAGSKDRRAGDGGDAEDAPAEVEKEEGEEQGLPSMRALSRISQDGAVGGGAEGRRPFREQVEEAMMLAAGGEEAATGGTAAGVSDAGVGGAGSGAPQRLALGSVLALGPRNVGPNVLCLPPSFRLRILWSAGDDAEKGGGVVEEPTEVALVDPAAAMAWMRSVAWPSLRNSLAVGFQMATASGPVAEEQMYGVGFAVEEVALLLKAREFFGAEGSGSGSDSGPHAAPLSVEDLDAWLTARLGSVTGQVMSSSKSAFRAAFLSSPVRLVEALFECDLQCDRAQLGKLYAVLSKRRGRVVEEDIIEGTDLFIIKAMLPVAESFGFATELLKKTSGAATSPQLAFSHWERMELDPFWRPQNEEDREEFGETLTGEANIARRYIDETRKRKGLSTGAKVVVSAEKERNLSKKK